MKKIKELLEKAAGIILCTMHYERYCGVCVKEDMKKLVPPLQLKNALLSYYSRKLVVSFLILIGGGMMTVILFVREQQKTELVTTENEVYVERASPGGENKNVTVTVDMNEGQSQMELTVEPVKYSREEFFAICRQIEEDLPRLIKGDNEDLEHINSDLNLIERYETYPVTIAWNSDDYTYIHTDGTVNKEELKQLQDEAFSVLSAVISYDTYEQTIRFPVRFVKAATIDETSVWERLALFLEEEQVNQRKAKRFILPDKFEGQTVSVREKRERSSFVFLMLTVFAVPVLFFATNQDLHKKTEKRKEQLLEEYPEFVSKLMLFMGAGMSAKAAFYQLCSDYKRIAGLTPKEEHYLYEELKYMLHSMENGVFETEAYEQFGKRCDVSQYRKLMALLTQNAKKGTDDFLHQLGEESRETFIQKKSEARRLGEKAGTKLLLPMVMMLGIVMVIIIVPAFLSYQI